MERNYEKSLKSQKGITLIALVLTIVVLLILAGVSIATLTGENGILTQAQKAKDATEQAARREQAELNRLLTEMNSQLGDQYDEKGKVNKPILLTGMKEIKCKR